MARKTGKKVPMRLAIDTRPVVQVDLKGPLWLRVLGIEKSPIVRLRLGRRSLEIYGSEESEPLVLPHRYLKRRGVSEIRDIVRERIRATR